jgi:hypothetical protein
MAFKDDLGLLETDTPVRFVDDAGLSGPATPNNAYNPVTGTTPQQGYSDAFLGEVPAFLGSMIGGTAKTAMRRIPYAGLAAAGGEGFHQAYQAITGDPNSPLSIEDSAKRMAEAATLYGAGQAVGEPLSWLGRTIFNNTLKVRPEYLRTDVAESERALAPYVESQLAKGFIDRQKANINKVLPESMQFNTKQYPGYTLGQQTEDISGAARFENIIESSFRGRDPLKRYKLAQERGAKLLVDDTIDQMWGDIEKLQPSQRGEAFVKAFDKAEDVFQSAAKEKYAKVDEVLSSKTHTITPDQAPGSTPITINKKYFVDISSIQKEAKEIAKKNKQFGGIGSSEAGDSLIKQISELPERDLSFAEAAELRSRLLKQASQMDGKDVAKGWAKNFAKKVDTVMDESAASVSPEAQKLWRDANKFYKEGKEVYDNEFIHQLIKRGEMYPADVSKAIFSDVNKIKMAKEVLKDSPETWKALQVGRLEDVIRQAQNRNADVSARSVFGQIKGIGKEAWEEGFTAEQRNMMNMLETALHYTQKKPQGSGGSMLIQLLQANAIPAVGGALIGSAGYGSYQGKDFDWEKFIPGAAMLASPRIFANMLLDPKYHTLFLKGMSSERARAMPALTKLVAAAIEVNSKMKENKTLVDTIAEQAQYR